MSNFQEKIKEIGILDKYLTDYEGIIKDKIKINNFLEQIELFKREKINLLNINRFCIPIIGKCKINIFELFIETKSIRNK